VELVRRSALEVVGEVHVAIVEEALSDEQVVAFVAVEHGHLAVVDRVATIDHQNRKQAKGDKAIQSG
jgi:hypothetical protein